MDDPAFVHPESRSQTRLIDGIVLTVEGLHLSLRLWSLSGSLTRGIKYSIKGLRTVDACLYSCHAVSQLHFALRSSVKGGHGHVGGEVIRSVRSVTIRHVARYSFTSKLPGFHPFYTYM